jgi:uncharacterized repeat protein (TIGR03837 family)
MLFDIFCKVVDNFGDIGVCWRLARQLAAEHQGRVRLWVDDLRAFHSLAPALNPAKPVQTLGLIEVCQWSDPFPATEPAPVVIETFGCDVPESYVEAMARQSRPPVWINLEYLSAEAWVEGCHRLPSPHPRFPLTRYFFFPGFTQATGGVMIEKGLIEQRDAFRNSPKAVAGLLARLGVRPPRDGERLISLFCYPQAPVNRLLDILESGPTRIRVLTFEGTPGARAVADRGMTSGRQRGALSVDVLPFLSQDDYDRVLWTCDLNFVRGEDSFVRAQLAARPLVWQAYPQADEAHRIKIEAFLARYSIGLDSAARSLAGFWHAWNGLAPADGLAGNWKEMLTEFDRLMQKAQSWARALEANRDLARNLAQFCSERV